MSYLRRYFQQLLFGVLVVLFTVLSLLSEGYFGGADNISHYLISHFACKYPSLFLNAWGRPLYTMVSAPFAIFGLQGAKILNIILGVTTAWLAFRIATMLKIRQAMAAMIFVCFTPLYFAMMPTALTEILFSFILVLSIFLFLRKDYVMAAVVVSFLPFARTEGYVLLPLFLAALWRAKQPKAIPFLATGILVFTIIGGIYYKDLLWLINRFPYPINYTHPIYNKMGSLWHFLEFREMILGLPMEILFVAGIGGIVRDLFSKDGAIRKNVWLLIILVVAPFMAYLVLHSLLFWKAMGGSMGLERVLAAVLPLAALISLKGFSDLEELFRNSRILTIAFTTIILGFIIYIPFKMYPVPYPLSPEEETIRRATDWLKTSPWSGRLFLYTDNNVPYFMKADPYRKNPVECTLFGDCKFLDTIPRGTVFIWDAHFGANESKIPIDSLLRNKRQKVVNYFRPAQPWLTFGGGWYDCYITRTIEVGETADNYAIRDSIQDTLDARKCTKLLWVNAFENPGDAWDPSYLTSDTIHLGKRAYRMDYRTEYSPGFTQPVSTLPVSEVKQELLVNIYVNIPQIRAEMNTLLVISFEHRNKSYGYTAVNLNTINLRPGKWNRVALSAPVPKFISDKDLVKVYIWNPGKQLFYLDDFKLYAGDLD
ncbi:MAG: hypothetical protein ACOYNC_07875 [Bacteroidales bacterium]